MKGLQAINLDEIIKQPNLTKQFSFNIDPTEIKELTGYINPSSPIRLDLSIRFADDIFYVTGELTGVLELECSRCMETVAYETNYPIAERYSLKTQKDEDIIILSKSKLQVEEILRESLEFAMPVKVLCKESCLGLCPHCGCNLNLSTCQCLKDQIDPRLAILKDLLKE
ncbi:YceD family protein [Anaerobranca gottschalkii]|uniref:DUF177 domain-containing protein n=1 Tax=Anaerobranca gottschalkii DSM 13577 TaxID=1120990 RepID=A0A1H9YZ05_9FIRM|nr:YceD family protein [Anaerobranca gottschalkii]SES74377.1 uncharacterized protein SAMN03080614_1005106 [Anaerobranca gottschalkii DSM 13577]